MERLTYRQSRPPMGTDMSLDKPVPSLTRATVTVAPGAGTIPAESQRPVYDSEDGQTLMELQRRTRMYADMVEQIGRRQNEIDKLLQHSSRKSSEYPVRTWPPGSQQSKMHWQQLFKPVVNVGGTHEGCAKNRSSEMLEASVPELLRPSWQPECLGDQPWVDAAMYNYFAYDCPKFWSMVRMDRQVGIGPDVFIAWMRYHAMADPAMYCVQAVNAALNALRPGSLSFKRITWLKLQAIREINLALSGPTFSTSILLAVLFFACYEAWSGCIDVARNAHVPGLRRMVEVKGGERAVMKDVHLFMMPQIRWLAESLTEITGTEPMFGPSTVMRDLVADWTEMKSGGGLWFNDWKQPG